VSVKLPDHLQYQLGERVFLQVINGWHRVWEPGEEFLDGRALNNNYNFGNTPKSGS
jgi:hypothetical protein